MNILPKYRQFMVETEGLRDSLEREEFINVIVRNGSIQMMNCIII
ncbi:hypothetical protein COLU111180_01840 [Cohnella lubricantis]